MYRRYQNRLLKRNLVYGGLLLMGAFVFLITLVIALAWVGGSRPGKRVCLVFKHKPL